MELGTRLQPWKQGRGQRSQHGAKFVIRSISIWFVKNWDATFIRFCSALALSEGHVN